MSITPKQTIKGTVAATQSARGVLKDIPSLDNTLTKEDYAADAKATGEAISQALADANTYTDTHTRSNKWMPTAEEVGARPDTWMPTAADVGARPDTWMPSASEIGARPDTWTPTAEEVGAATPADVQKFARKNLLDNWYFGNPVNQRGQTSYSVGWTYTIDRWMSSDGVSLGDGFITTNRLFYQKLDTHVFNAIKGKTVTVSVLLQDGRLASETHTFYASGYRQITVNGVLIYFGADIPGHGLNFPTVTIGNSHNIVAIKMELGAEQTLAHQENGVWVLNEIPDYREQLAKCQHYLLMGSIRGVPTNRWGHMIGFAVSTPVTVRNVNPTIIGETIINCTDGPSVFLGHTVHATLATNNDIYLYTELGSSADAAKATAIYFEAGSGLSMEL